MSIKNVLCNKTPILPTLGLLIFGLTINFAPLSAAEAHEYTALMRAKKYAEVERAVTLKLQAEPNNADALIAKSSLILIEGKDGQFDAAQSLTEKCIAAHPERSECHEAFGNVVGSKIVNNGILSALGSARKVRDAFIKAIELDPKNFNARNSLLQYYLQAPSFAGGSVSKAQNLVLETMKISPAARSLLQATIELKEEKYARAEATALAVSVEGMETLIDMQRGVLTNLGHTYLKDKKYVEAERLFKEVSQRYPDNGAGNYGMGRLLQEQAKYKDAIAFFEKANLVDSTAYGYYRIAQCLQSLKENAKAIMAFEKALVVKPGLAKKPRTDVEDQIKSLKGA
jgi:tetratricopeptide (TPR) repeat protein